MKSWFRVPLFLFGSCLLAACGPHVVITDGGDGSPETAAETGPDVASDVPVTCTPSGPELCDGRDNDCDGTIDNGQLCSGGLQCMGGVCACPASRLCGTVCSDLTTDNANCGSCGNACGVGFSCQSGTCGCATAGRTACGGLCVDLQTDRHHCGSCSVDCGTTAVCTAGHCSTGPTNLDLLLMIDNSNSMRDNQTNLMSQVSSLLNILTSPPCISPTNPTPHTCNPSDPRDVPAYAPVTSMHVGIVSSDLGTPGSAIPGCANSDLGDDGFLNPIRFGQALAHHEPWTTAPTTFGRPTDCTDPNQFPSFITFTSGVTDPVQFAHDFQCNAGLYINGCGLEAQLESVYRALIIHDATDRAGNISPNAGFVRADSTLAIVLLTDEEDGSVRDCRFANGMPCSGSGALDVYNAASTAWASMELNLRFYRYQPCGAQDPTWPLDRYINPIDPNVGFLSLKPGHPERVIFSAITGVPLNIPTVGTGTSVRIDWNRLIGTPGTDPNNFCMRDSSGLGSLTSAEGPVSMMQANPDPGCAQRVVPACRREGSVYSIGCTTTDQYFAWPSRRIVEVARRFDESLLCGGAACRNGSVTSICGSNYAGSFARILQLIQGRL